MLWEESRKQEADALIAIAGSCMARRQGWLINTKTDLGLNLWSILHVRHHLS
jgi:hypothetical protein